MKISKNMKAFLDMIAYSEGTDRRGDPYRVCFGYAHEVKNMSDHPAVTGEWLGEPLDHLGQAYRGKVSTAAGKYQIIKKSWLEGKNKLGLKDFSPESQDAWAIWKIGCRNASHAVEEGHIHEAIILCKKEWASFPSSGYGQHENKMEKLLAFYNKSGGNSA